MPGVQDGSDLELTPASGVELDERRGLFVEVLFVPG
jgi:hypothetical protein